MIPDHQLMGVFMEAVCMYALQGSICNDCLHGNLEQARNLAYVLFSYLPGHLDINKYWRKASKRGTYVQL